ncbi:MAG: hypothetical protein IT292_10545 [Deltaproteobacteria bacterium]|nr:hypothetical protein [Deltaproteobacteria bacterium]
MASGFQQIEAQTQALISSARELLAYQSEEIGELYIEKLACYTDDFERWEIQIAKLPALTESGEVSSPQRASLKTLFEELNVLHNQLLESAKMLHEKVGENLGSIHKRAKGIKTYVAPSSEPITITGRRRG